MDDAVLFDHPGLSRPTWPSKAADVVSPHIQIPEHFLQSSDLLGSHELIKSLEESPQSPAGNNRDALLFLLPLLIVLSTFLFLVLLFLVFVILLRKRRGV